MHRFIISILIVTSLAFYSFAQEKVGRIIAHKQKGREVLFRCDNGHAVKLSIVSDDIVRVQVSPDGKFEPSLMISYGYVKDDFKPVNYTVNEEEQRFRISTASTDILVDKQNFAFTLLDKKGNLIVRSNQKTGIHTGAKNILNFDMPADEHFFGFGFMRETLDARGSKLSFRREYRWKGATVPFFMSTRGYAFYSNSVYNHEFDFTPKSNDGTGDFYTIESNGKAIDFYLIVGSDFPKLLDRYTDLTGKSMLVPRWAFGLEYRLRYYGDQNELLSVAKEFRNKEIPSDIMALEPGWEEVSYSMKWKWSPERFPEPKRMIDELAALGFKLDLWESGIAPTENITDLKTRQKWYGQRKEIVDMGVRMFKQDDPYPRSIVSSELLDPVFARQKIKDNKLSAEELNNVANSLYTETLFNEFRKQTNERAIVMFHAYNASVASHRWPFQWAGDFQAENGMLNASLSGHAMVSYDIRNPYAAGWHQGFFTPFTVVDAWAYYREPWLYSESIEESHRVYACLRSRLVPYLYSSLYQSHKSGLPIERPMVLNYANDPVTHQMKSQFMVGDWFLLALSDVDDSPSGEKIDFWTGLQKGNHGRIYLPEGKWINYWNGEVKNIEKAQWVQGDWPEFLGGLLYVKAGAIIPMGQVKNFIGETKDEVVVLDVYPYNESGYRLYEDDGISYKYEEGETAITDIRCNQTGSKVNLTISARKGNYKDMPEKRTFLVKMHSLLKPKNITVDGTELNNFRSINDLIYSDDKNGWFYDSENMKAIIKLDKGWKYQETELAKNPLATIPLTAKNERVLLNKNTVFSNSGREILVDYPEKAVVEFSSNTNTLPADGISLAQIKIHPSNPTEITGKIDLRIKGSATFRNGKTELTLDASDEKTVEIQSGTTAGVATLTVTGNGIEPGSFDFPVYGKPTQLKLENTAGVLVADSRSKFNLLVKLFDKNQSQIPAASTPVVVKANGEALFINGLQSDTVFVRSGNADIKLKLTATPGPIKVTASFADLKDVEVVTTSVKAEMQVRINPPEKVKLSSDGSWIPDRVDVFVNFKANGQWVNTLSNKVVLNVYNKQNQLLATYTQDAKNGEVIFKDITYYKRPAQCLFEIKSEGYETITRKVFANTWDIDPNAPKIQK